ncbi:MAG TPA: hypothetical protein VJR90_07400 [Gammaproteobacteria bacterium]|nr:hypothetical protein [Gammaproteobacteria bacterium]
MKYKCPLCGSPLTESHFHKVIKIQEKKEKIQEGELGKLKKQAAAAQAAAAAAKRKEREIRAESKQKIYAATKEAAAKERKKTAIRDKRMAARIKKLEEERKMLKSGTSPQEIGLADEQVLVRRLREEFPGDKVERTEGGRGGDVLHQVIFGNEAAGRVIYECKHTDRITTDHITQTALAKKTRNADYGILVTTGTRKKFAGLDQDSGIFIVSQSGVLTLASICRDSLVEMAKQRLDAAAKEAAAKRLMGYVTSPVCKTPLEEAILHTEHAHKNLLKEMEQHKKVWEERHEIYQTIHYDISHVRNNIARVLSGHDPLSLEKPKFEPLALPKPG